MSLGQHMCTSNACMGTEEPRVCPSAHSPILACSSEPKQAAGTEALKRDRPMCGNLQQWDLSVYDALQLWHVCTVFIYYRSIRNVHQCSSRCDVINVPCCLPPERSERCARLPQYCSALV